MTPCSSNCAARGWDVQALHAAMQSTPTSGATSGYVSGYRKVAFAITALARGQMARRHARRRAHVPWFVAASGVGARSTPNALASIAAGAQQLRA